MVPVEIEGIIIHIEWTGKNKNVLSDQNFIFQGQNGILVD